MSARNIFHDAVRDALVADGWTITHDPFGVPVGARRLQADIGAERAALGAEREGSQIAVEVQSFLRKSPIEDLHHAVGQYAVYRAVMRRTNPGREVFLAVPQVVYTEGIFGELLGEIVTADLGIKLLVFHPTQRRIIEWRS